MPKITQGLLNEIEKENKQKAFFLRLSVKGEISDKDLETLKNSTLSEEELALINDAVCGQRKDTSFLRINFPIQDTVIKTSPEQGIRCMELCEGKNFSMDEINMMLNCLYLKNLSSGDQKICANATDLENMEARIYLAYNDKFPNAKLEKYCNKGLNKNQMEIIQMALKDGLSEKYIDMFADKTLDEKKMFRLKEDILYGLDKGLTFTKIRAYAKPELLGKKEKGRGFGYDDSKIKEIIQGELDGLTMRQVQILANPNFSANQVKYIREAMETGAPEEEIRLYTSLTNKSEDRIEQIHEGLKNGLSVEDVMVYANLNNLPTWQISAIRECVEDEFCVQDIELLKNENLDKEQVRQIILGMENNLPIEDLEMYADEVFSGEQMRQIRIGLRDHEYKEEVRLYADPKIPAENMRAIRVRMKNRLELTPEEYELDRKDSYIEMNDSYKEFATNLLINDWQEVVKYLDYETLENIYEKSWVPLMYQYVQDKKIAHAIIEEYRGMQEDFSDKYGDNAGIHEEERPTIKGFIELKGIPMNEILKEEFRRGNVIEMVCFLDSQGVDFENINKEINKNKNQSITEEDMEI